MARDELLELLAALRRSHARLAWLYWLLVEAIRPPLEPGNPDAPGWAKVPTRETKEAKP